MTFVARKPLQVGTIEQVLKADVIEKVFNDGAHTYTHLRQDCLNNMPVSDTSTTIRIPLTNPNVDVVQFDKSFIRIIANVACRVSGFEAAAGGTDSNDATASLQTFIGVKNASDCIDRYSLYHKGQLIMRNDDGDGTVESFIYNVLRDENELKNRVGVHSIAGEVNDSLNTSYCGDFVSLSTIQNAVQNNNSIIVIQLGLVIPYSDIPVFQEFQSYPAALFGDLELRFTFNMRPLVSMICEPEKCFKNTASMLGVSALATCANPNKVLADKICREYVQCGDTFKGITHAKIASNAITYATGNVSITPISFSVTSCFATVVGCRAQPEALEKMRHYFEVHPWTKHCQRIGYHSYQISPTAGGIDMTQQIPLENTTSFIVLFPTTTNESRGTVSKNPMLDNLSLTVSGIQYPSIPIDTSSWSFLEMMRNSANTWDETPSHEFTNSISAVRWTNTAVLNPTEDATSFLVCIKVERPSAMGLVNDGLNTNGVSVPVRLRATPSCISRYDEYCGYATDPSTGNARENPVPPPAPVIVTVNDAYLVFNAKRGGQCRYSTAPYNEYVSGFMSS